jgi:inward rectifier potassium channel
VLTAETSPEGSVFRRVQDLKLVRDDMPIFPLTWIWMHLIDETSPLFGLEPEALEAGKARFFVSVQAQDSAMGATVHGLNTFLPSQVAYGKRYIDAVMVGDFGRIITDISRLSLIE